MKFLICSFAVLACALSTVQALSDSQAQEECRRIHHMDADASGTGYFNNGCRLDCNIHGKVYSHNVHEGQNCVAGRQDYQCQQGRCVSVNYNQIGHIDVELISASLYDRADAYATACIQNNSNPVELPLRDRRGCTECSSHVQQNTNYPVWNEVCSGSSNFYFVQDSRVTIEVWNYHSSSNKEFLGGSTLTINDLIAHGDNHRTLHMALVNGRNPGQVNSRITWTPRN